ncbi:hypothetical protein GTW51_18720 [Aurantimonas aggregata]|uniref:Uncharacterized protein n=1 Tax=Aurantimonas aggregata TaxID=2047720 RepID=A0A6L9MM77_9HYPH|nr:hypothetical protein [Aurantimonas aggregata]NDV88736.1 hypothetical protein [Aurantimonas aggregata]
MGDMTDRSRRAATVVLVMAGAALLGGCGVKNMPVAPDSDGTPTVVTTEGNTATGNSILGSGSGASTVSSERISAIEDDNIVSAAEVSRNPASAGSTFILDPLLN